MKNRFEQLIEYVINDEDQKARELFHDIVVEKSRSIYESLMAEEAEEESVEESREEEEESVEEGREEEEESLEEDDAMGRMDQYDETMGGDQADDLIDDVSAEEEGMSMEGEGEGETSVEDLEDRVVSLEDKLDELMAEFEAELGGGDDMGMGGDDMDMEVDVDAADTPDMTDMEVDDDELETEGMMEAISLKSAPAPVKSEEGSINKKSTVAANAGAKGPIGSTVKPVSASTAEEKGRTAPGTKDLISDFQNKAGASMKDQKPATKPHLAQATGVNTKSPLAKA